MSPVECQQHVRGRISRALANHHVVGPPAGDFKAKAPVRYHEQARWVIRWELVKVV